jgi:hypothetical protein
MDEETLNTDETEEPNYSEELAVLDEDFSYW